MLDARRRAARCSRLLHALDRRAASRALSVVRRISSSSTRRHLAYAHHSRASSAQLGVQITAPAAIQRRLGRLTAQSLSCMIRSESTQRHPPVDVSHPAAELTPETRRETHPASDAALHTHAQREHARMDALFTNLTTERATKETLIRGYMDAAAADGRDLTDTEQETMKAARSRISAIDAQLELIADDLAMADSVRDKLRGISTATQLMGSAQYRSAGDLLWDMLHQNEEGARVRYARQMKRAAEHMGTEATTTVPVAGDLGGLITDPVRGPIIDPYPSGMPFASALGLTESTDSMHWKRPRIVDPNFVAGVGQQGSAGTLGFEKAELPSKKFDVEADLVSLKTIGGYLNISEQLLAFVAGALDTIVGHMNKRLANAIDTMLIAEMQLSTGKVTLAAGADSAAILKAIYDASAAVYASTGDLAQWIVMGPLGYARLGSLVDLAGRPLFPTLGAANAIGTANASTFVGSVAGLRVVVTPAITDDTFWVGNGMVIEGALYRFPVLQAVEPSVLGRQIAVAASAAGYRPIPNGAVHLAP